MKVHRFIGDFDFSQKTLVLTDSELVHQLQNVLRIKRGDRIFLSNGAMNEAEAEIVAVDVRKNSGLKNGSIAVDLVRVFRNETEPERSVTLFAGIIKRDLFELVVEKATEVGVQKIVPLYTKRTVKFGARRERLCKIAKEAAEQSGRGLVPELSEPMLFKKALSLAKKNGQVLLFHPGGSTGSPQGGSDVPFGKASGGGAPVSVFIGPEGGFDESEIDEAKEAGARISSLGALTLRAETAAIIASYLAVRKEQQCLD